MEPSTLDAPAFPADTKISRSNGMYLLNQAFGRRLIEGREEWEDVPEVIRMALLLLAKAVRRLDSHVMTLIDQKQQRQGDGVKMEDREHDIQSALVRCQLVAMSEQMQLLTAQVQDVRKAKVIDHALVKQRLQQLECSSGERYTRLKRKVVRLMVTTKSSEITARRLDEQLSQHTRDSNDRMQLLIDKMNNHIKDVEVWQKKWKSKWDNQRIAGPDASEKEHVCKNEALLKSSSMYNKIDQVIHSQKTCQKKITRLQYALAAYDKRVYARSRAILGKLTELQQVQNIKSGIVEKTKPANTIKVECSTTDRHMNPSEPIHLDSDELVHVGDSQRTEHTEQDASKTEVGKQVTHASLKERYADARRKQQQYLAQLRIKHKCNPNQLLMGNRD